MNIETAVGPSSLLVISDTAHSRLSGAGFCRPFPVSGGGRGCRTRDVWAGRGADLLLTSQYTFGVLLINLTRICK